MLIQYKDLILQHFPKSRTIDCMQNNTVKMYIDNIHVATFDRSWWNSIVDDITIDERSIYDEHGKVQ